MMIRHGLQEDENDLTALYDAGHCMESFTVPFRGELKPATITPSPNTSLMCPAPPPVHEGPLWLHSLKHGDVTITVNQNSVATVPTCKAIYGAITSSRAINGYGPTCGAV
ncbi:uncharacterized protein LOC126239793 [Schistocerca nitens]|uniref:uncharacterized protein LOC126239793 n=1 Tax=Schistocerca nitens TaxID=7011 RepID=UPI0021179E1C|nr:uncharacterized protein LOC126239793 [Schistocerca nitens]